MSSSKVKPKKVEIYVPRPTDVLEQALSRYKGLINSQLKPPDKPDAAVPYLEEVDFVIDFKKCKLKETSMSPQDYQTPAFKKANVTPETECYYLAVIRNNKVMFNNKSNLSGYLVHQLAYPTVIDKKPVNETQIKFDMYASMIEFLVTYGLEWIEHSVQRQAKQEVEKTHMKVSKDVEELESLADEIGKTDE
jgi:hypothetical protein